MSIEYLIRSTAFDPEAVNAMLAAYDRVRKALTLADGDDCANWSVATKIVEQVLARRTRSRLDVSASLKGIGIGWELVIFANWAIDQPLRIRRT